MRSSSLAKPISIVGTVGASHTTISTREEESEADRDILAAVTKADCCDSAGVAAAMTVTTGSASRPPIYECSFAYLFLN